jgi:hypothetical protein
VTVIDVDERPTTGAPASLNVSENMAAGASVGFVSATDPESQPLTYTLTTPDVPFQVNAATGEVITTAALDRETASSYALAFRASDGTTAPIALSASVAVTNVDEQPTPGAVTPLAVGENLPSGTVVGSISATDPEGATISYALATQNVPFAVNAATGQVTTTAALNREQFASYNLAFTASDGTSTATTINRTVSVGDVDEQPTAGAALNAALSEEIAAGTLVGTVSATGPEGVGLTYALTTPNVPFAVNAATGQVTTTAALNYEQLASYTLAFTASDGTTAPIALSGSVTVANVDESPTTGAPATFALAENLAAGTVVGTVSATAPKGEALAYALTTPNVPFTVNAATGVVTTTAALDRESVPSYALAFTATDGTNTTPLNATVNVTNVNEAPVPAGNPSFVLLENLPAGTVVGSVSASDADSASVGYTLATTGVPFRVNAVTGQITTTAPLNREAITSYTLDVRATDGSLASSPITVSIGVADVNEPPAPVGTGPFNVAENLPAGTLVGTVSTTDAEGAGVTYTLTTQNVPFLVNASSARSRPRSRSTASSSPPTPSTSTPRTAPTRPRSASAST